MTKVPKQQQSEARRGAVRSEAWIRAEVAHNAPPPRLVMRSVVIKAARHRCRTESGGQIAELGPALFVICILIFIPIMDLVYMSGAYASGWYLNQIEAREVASTLPDIANNPLNTNPPPAWPPGKNMFSSLGSGNQPYIDIDVKYQTWKNSGIAIFCGGVQKNLYIYYNGVANPNAPPADICDYSITTTDIQVKPFIPVPWFTQVFNKGVPGLSVDWINRYSTRSIQEEKGLN